MKGRKQFIQTYTRVNRKLEAKYYGPVYRALRAQAKAVIARLNAGGVPAAQKYLHDTLGNPAMAKAIRDLHVKVGLTHARLNYSRLLLVRRKSRYSVNEVKGFGFNPEWTTYILNYLNKFLLDKVTFAISETTRDAMLRVLTAATVSGASIDQIVDRLEDWPFLRYQAARIARTETNRAANVGASAQESTSEFQQVKEWLAVHDHRTRGQHPKDHASHVGLNGTVVDAGDFFVDPRNGDKLMFPGDPSASAASTVNCRCSVGYEFKRDPQGELVPKRRSTTVIYPSQVRRPQTILI